MLYLIITSVISLILGAWLFQSSISLKYKMGCGIIIFWHWLWALVFNFIPEGPSWLFPADVMARDMSIRKLLEIISSKFSTHYPILNVFAIIYIGIQLMPMLLMALAVSAYIQSSQSSSNAKYIIIILTFLASGLLFFTIPPCLASLLISFVHEQGREGGFGKIVIEGLMALLLISITTIAYAISQSKNP